MFNAFDYFNWYNDSTTCWVTEDLLFGSGQRQNLSLLGSLQTGSEGHSIHYLAGTGAYCLGVKQPKRETDC
jgi:hypothetical protein